MKKQNKKENTRKTESQAVASPKGLTEECLRFYPFLLVAVALAAVMGVLTVVESSYLQRVEELNLFLYTPLFFQQQLVVAGGMLTYLGTCFTQFFYHPWLGSLLLCGWLGLLAWLVKRTFCIPNQWGALLLVPVALVLITDFDLGYWIYYMKLRGHFFVLVMGASLAVALTWAYRAATRYPWLAYVVLVLTGLAAYPLAGIYGLLALLLMAVITWRLPLSVAQKAARTALAVAFIIFGPLICYRNVYYQTNSDFIWMQALPNYEVDKVYFAYYWPYILLALFLVLAAIFFKQERKWQPVNRKLLWLCAQLAVVLVVTLGTWHFWYKDKSFHEEIEMTACVDRQDWEGVLTLMRQHDGDPTRMMVMYKNLALFRLGRAGNEMYNYRDGSQAPNSPFDLRIAQIGGKNIYLYYGLPNYCYRWCLEDGVEYGWRVEHLKFLTRCAILNGETVVAKKYIDLLRNTLYHGEWADRYAALLTDEIDENIAKCTELGPVRRLMKGSDLLGSDQSLIELFMLNSQAYRQTDDPVCAELVLLSALQLKDIPAFWRAFSQYANLHVGEPMPRHFQEAAYLYGHLEKNVDISSMPFDPAVKQSYDGFMQLAQRCRGMKEEQMKPIFYPQYGNTFYYNYFLMRNLRSY